MFGVGGKKSRGIKISKFYAFCAAHLSMVVLFAAPWLRNSRNIEHLRERGREGGERERMRERESKGHSFAISILVTHPIGHDRFLSED